MSNSAPALIAATCLLAVLSACEQPAEGGQPEGVDRRDEASAGSSGAGPAEAAAGTGADADPRASCASCVQQQCSTERDACAMTFRQTGCHLVQSCIANSDSGAQARACEQTWEVPAEPSNQVRALYDCFTDTCAECFAGPSGGAGAGGADDECSSCSAACSGLPGCSCCDVCGGACFN